MKTRYKIIIIIVIAFSIIFGYIWTQTNLPLLVHHTECFEMGKIPVVDKFGNEQYMVSCMNINPFGN